MAKNGGDISSTEILPARQDSLSGYCILTDDADDVWKEDSLSITPKSEQLIFQHEDRFDFLKRQFDDYRSKANKALTSKDKLIASLQRRLQVFLEEKSNGSRLVDVKALEAERQKLTVRLDKLESEYEREKCQWYAEKDHLMQTRTQCDCSVTIQRELEKAKNRVNSLENARCIWEEELNKMKQQNKHLIDENHSMIKNLEMSKKENNVLQSRLEKFPENSDFCNKNQIANSRDKESLQLENDRLKNQLEQMRETYEVNDVEAEEKITMLANKIEELDEMLEEKSRECLVLQNTLQECWTEQKKVEEKVANLKKRLDKQADLEEELKEQLEKITDVNKHNCKEKDELLTRNASLSHQLNFQKKTAHSERESILQQVNMAGKELQDCIDRLKNLEFDILKSTARNCKNKAVSSSCNNLNFTDINTSLSVASLVTKIDALEKDMATKTPTVDNKPVRLSTIRSLNKKFSSGELLDTYF